MNNCRRYHSGGVAKVVSSVGRRERKSSRVVQRQSVCRRVSAPGHRTEIAVVKLGTSSF